MFLNRCACVIFLLICSAVSPSTVFAHHSFAAVFTNDEITVEGVVDQFKFNNPHTRIYFTVTDDAGEQTEWISEGLAAAAYRRLGWSKDSLTQGDTIRVTGNSTRNGSAMVSAGTVEIIDPATGQVTGTPSGEAPRDNASGIAPMQLADGRPNISGAWRRIAHGRPDDPSGAAFTPKAQALQDVFDPINDPQVQCEPPGLVRLAAATPHPVSIAQYDDRIVLGYEEYGDVRTVYLDQEINANTELSHHGQSTAHYDGQKLIILSTHLLGNLTGTNGNALSDQTTTLETYYRNDDDQTMSSLTMDMVITDPEHLSEPWTISWRKFYIDNYEFIDVDCEAPS